MIRTTQLKQVPVGKTFEVWDRKFAVLRSDEDRVFVLAAELETQMPFREDGEVYKVAPNDFRDSTIRNWLNNEYLGLLQEKGLKNGDILDLYLDLKCTLVQHEYGTDKVKAGLLTLEQYGEYYDIIPAVDDWWCLATPWKTPSRSPYTRNVGYVWYVNTNGGCNNYNYSTTLGVRPALNLSPSLLVAWEDEDCEEDAEEEGDWDGYIKYLHKWAVEHSSKYFEGCCPAAYEDYDEWKDGEE